MAKRQSKIRWRESDLNTLQRAINNFNAKLYRTNKKNPDMAQYMPSRVKKSDVIKSIGTRADFNRTINSLKRFSAKGAETVVSSKRGAKATQWEKREFQLRKQRVNRARSIERKKVEQEDVLSRGKSTGSKRAEMGTIKENELKPIKLNFENLSQKEWELKKTAIDRALDEGFQEFRKYNMKQNYIKGLENAGFSVDLIDVVRKTDIDTFVRMVRTDTEAQFDFIYDPIAHKDKEDVLMELWENAEVNLSKLTVAGKGNKNPNGKGE